MHTHRSVKGEGAQPPSCGKDCTQHGPPDVPYHKSKPNQTPKPKPEPNPNGCSYSSKDGKKIRVCTSPANRMRRSNQTGNTRTQLKSQGHKTRTRASRALHYSGGSIPRKKRPNPIFCCLCFWRHFFLTDALVTAASRGRCLARHSRFFRASPRRVLPHWRSSKVKLQLQA